MGGAPPVGELENTPQGGGEVGWDQDGRADDDPPPASWSGWSMVTGHPVVTQLAVTLWTAAVTVSHSG